MSSFGKDGGQVRAVGGAGDRVVVGLVCHSEPGFSELVDHRLLDDGSFVGGQEIGRAHV